MTTAVLADLHLGSSTSVLATPVVRDRVAEALQGADRVVLLGDTLSLRDAPVEQIVSAALPFFAALAEVVGDGEVVVVPGNHDHRLALPLLEQPAAPAALERRIAIGSAEQGPLARLWRALGRAEVTLAYPGTWLRPDVYATHGHYLDCHSLVPRIESVAARAMARIAGGPPRDGAAPGDYEALLAPLYGFAYGRAQAATAADGARSPAARVRDGLVDNGWARLVRGSRSPRSLLLGSAVGALALAAVARPGSPVRGAFTPEGVSRAGLAAMAALVARLAIPAEHVVFGHIHRAGPLAGEAGEWVAPGAPRLHNPGSWMYVPELIGPAAEHDPYWPGHMIMVGADGPPRLRSVLS